MVTRQYKCKGCGKDFEVMQSIKDDMLRVCECGGELKSVIASDIQVLWFPSGIHGAITKRYLDKGSVRSPWNLRDTK